MTGETARSGRQRKEASADVGGLNGVKPKKLPQLWRIRPLIPPVPIRPLIFIFLGSSCGSRRTRLTQDKMSVREHERVVL
jgi:hypothetical protein